MHSNWILHFASFANKVFAEVFSVPTKQFLGYEMKVWLPYFIKRHIFRQDIVKPPPIIEKAGKDDNGSQSA